MSEKFSKDLDEALGALVRAERTAHPEVSTELRARVLADAAGIAAEAAARRRPAAAARPGGRRRSGGQPGLLGRLRGLDLWTGAVAAAALLCLAAGLGVGYGAGDAVLAGTGLSENIRVAQAEEQEVALLGEDVL